MPYVIAYEVDAEGNRVAGESKGLAERAYHPEEVKANPALRLDADYYLAQQVGGGCSRIQMAWRHAGTRALGLGRPLGLVSPARSDLRTPCDTTRPRPQVFPVVSRLCAPIEGTDAGRLADCLGLDGSRYRQAAAAAGESREDALLAAAASLDDEDRWPGAAAAGRGPGAGARRSAGLQHVRRFSPLCAAPHGAAL